MKEYCQSRVQDGRYSFPCPHPNCRQIWEFFLVRHVACLDNQTRSTVEKEVTENYIAQGRNHQQCPGCNTWCTPFKAGDIRLQCPACTRSTGRPYDFCWACQREWNSTDLKYCGNFGCDGKDPRIKILRIAAAKNPITIGNVQSCPSIRACPKCGLLLSHIGGCRHMTCTCCGAEFCFICLRRWNNTFDVGFPDCSYAIAPVQEVLSDPFWDNRRDLCPTSPTRPPPAREGKRGDDCIIL